MINKKGLIFLLGLIFLFNLILISANPYEDCTVYGNCEKVISTTINNNTFAGNSSTYADIWITSEGNMDDVSDLNNYFWTTDTDQTGLTGNKAGSFDINTTGNIFLQADNAKQYFGAGDDYSIEWSGFGAVHNITSGDFAFSGGNVGIGTSAPAHVLTVDQGAGSVGLQMISDGTGATATDGFTIVESSNDIYLNNREVGDLIFYANGDERMRINSFGNVGIGTSSPGQELVVVGDANITGNVTASYFIGDGSQITGITEDNSTWSQSKADTLYTNQTYVDSVSISDGSDEGQMLYWNSSDWEAESVDSLKWDNSLLSLSLGGSVVRGNGCFAIGNSDDVQSGAPGLHGSFASGYIVETGGKINASGNGDFAQGITLNALIGSGVGIIENRGSGAFTQGKVYPSLFQDDDAIISVGLGNEGAFAQGFSATNLTASASGAFAQGSSDEYSEGIFASGIGSFAQGFASADDNITASGIGSFAHGSAGNGDIVASGTSSLAVGDDVISTQTLSFSFGEKFVNDVSDSFMVGYSSIPTFIVTNFSVSINNKTGSTYPLEVWGDTGDVSIWSEKNVSATGYITRTSAYDKTKGDPFDYIKDSSYYRLPSGNVNHSSFGYSHVTYQAPIWEYYSELVNVHNDTECDEAKILGDYHKGVFSNKEEFELIKSNYCTITPVYVNETRRRVSGYQTQEGVKLDMEVDLLRQALYELKIKNEELEARIAVLESQK